MKKTFCKVCIFSAFLFFCFPFFLLSAKERMADLKKELRENRALAELNRRIPEYIADRKEYLQMGIEKGLINANEEKKILRSLERIRFLHEKLKEKGKITVNDRKNINREMARCYRLIWFSSRPAGPFIYSFNGKKFYLKNPWQAKYEKSALNQKDMEEIMKVLQSSWQLRDSMNKDKTQIRKIDKKQITFQVEKLLLDKYFTLEEPASLQEKKKSGKKDIQKQNHNRKKKTVKKEEKGNP